MTDVLIDHKPSPNLLNRLLDQPGLVDMVQHLEPVVLTRLIRHIGLEDAAGIVSMATAEQLRKVFDEDLWHSDGPGQDDTFDADRFILWLEVMLENGAAFAAGKIEQFDEDLVTLALSKHLLVLDLDALAMPSAGVGFDDEEYLLDKTLDGCLSQEFDQFLVIARNHRSWDTVLTLLVELNECRFDLCGRLLERCAQHSSEYIEDNGGLYDVLTAEEMLAQDMAAERDDRRQREGFVTPSSAAAFLSRGRTVTLKKMASAKSWDPETRMYFRALEDSQTEGSEAGREDLPPEPGMAESRQTFIALLQEALVLEAPQQFKQIGFAETPSRQTMLGRAMQNAKATDEDLYARRLNEISYLANVLMAGCPFMGRRFRPVEAAEAAMGVCQLGAEYLLGETIDAAQAAGMSKIMTLLESHDAVKMFNLGWKLLHEQVAMFAADKLLGLLSQLKIKTADPRGAVILNALTASLQQAIKSALPARFLPEMDDLFGFMDNAWVAMLMPLLNEYPFMPQALRGQHGLSDAPFISTQPQVAAIQELLADLDN